MITEANAAIETKLEHTDGAVPRRRKRPPRQPSQQKPAFSLNYYIDLHQVL